MAKVYIPMIPSRFDKPSGMWMPSVDISVAEKFGEIVVMLPPEAGRVHTVPLLTAIREKMSGYTRDDYVVALGDPTIIACVACLAVRHTGGLLRMLKWDRSAADYLPIEVTP